MVTAPGSAPASAFHCARAALPDGVRADVLVEVAGGRVTAVRPGVPPPPHANRLPGLTLPGLANAHSHAFHRALRGRTHGGRGDFWSWRETMYAVAERLDPDRYLRLATAAYAEMALAGFTAVGEFHYLHHQAGGRPYDDPNAMGHALVAAAATAGIRLTLLDTCYLQAAPDGTPLAGPQLRFGDRDAGAWAERATSFRAAVLSSATSATPGDLVPVVGAAVHSVRACPPAAMRTVAAWSGAHDAPLHLHLGEQRRENEECVAAHGRTPTALAADTGVLDRAPTAVHATHLTDGDVRSLGRAAAYACFCPTTERDLGDGLGPARALADAGARLCLGSDSHAVVDPFEEARAVELHERLAHERRGVFTARELLAHASAHGYASLGLGSDIGCDIGSDVGGERGGAPRPGATLPAAAIGPGALADLVTVRTDGVRLAGAPDGDALLAAVLYAAAPVDVTTVVVGGRVVVEEGVHVRVPEAARALRDSIEELVDS